MKKKASSYIRADYVISRADDAIGTFFVPKFINMTILYVIFSKL